jgi:hypothetical protein
MTIPCAIFPNSPRLKRSLAYAPGAKGLPRRSPAVCRPSCAGTESGMGDTPTTRHDRAFAPSRCYLVGSRVMHDLDRRYPVLSAPTGSCVTPSSSISLCVSSDPQSWQVAVSPAASRRFPALSLQIFPRMPRPLPRWSTRCTYPFLPVSHRPSPSPTGSAVSQNSVQRLQNGGAFAAAVIR